MKRSNWSWGALRISQELGLLGISIHKKTVQRILQENGLVPPKTRIAPPTWTAFLKAHKHMWALDFTCLMDFQGLQIFVLAVIDLNTRQLVSINATASPDRHWIIQQICNAEMVGFRLPNSLIADNDGIFGRWLDRDFRSYFGIEVGMTPPGMPWCNGICERFHRSLKNEVLRRLGATDLGTIRSYCLAFQKYYNTQRPHQGIGGATPIKSEQGKVLSISKKQLKYRKFSDCDGLITRFELHAA